MCATTVKGYVIARRTVVLPLGVGGGVGGSSFSLAAAGPLASEPPPDVAPASGCSADHFLLRLLPRPEVALWSPTPIATFPAPSSYPPFPPRNDNGLNRIHHSKASIPLRPPSVVRRIRGRIGPTAVFRILPPSIPPLSPPTAVHGGETAKSQASTAPHHLMRIPHPPSPFLTLKDICNSFRLFQNSLLDDSAEGPP